jgi:hypothetical protein
MTLTIHIYRILVDTDATKQCTNLIGVHCLLGIRQIISLKPTIYKSVIKYGEMLDVAKLGLRKHHEDNVAWQRAFLIHAFLSPPYYCNDDDDSISVFLHNRFTHTFVHSCNTL